MQGYRKIIYTKKNPELSGVVVLGWEFVGGKCEKAKPLIVFMSLNTFNVPCYDKNKKIKKSRVDRAQLVLNPEHSFKEYIVFLSD